jgi:hypothetical protein
MTEAMTKSGSTREEFYERYSIYKNYYAKLKRLGMCAKELNPPGTKLFIITAQAEREWLKMMEKHTESEAAKLAAARRSEIAKRAAAQSLASPKHVMHRKVRGTYNSKSKRAAEVVATSNVAR